MRQTRLSQTLLLFSCPHFGHDLPRRPSCKKPLWGLLFLRLCLYMRTRGGSLRRLAAAVGMSSRIRESMDMPTCVCVCVRARRTGTRAHSPPARWPQMSCRRGRHQHVRSNRLLNGKWLPLKSKAANSFTWTPLCFSGGHYPEKNVFSPLFTASGKGFQLSG